MNEENNKPTIDERLAALTMNVELLAGSTSDLRAIVVARIDRDREREERDRKREERDRKYLNLVADILKQWANDEETESK